MNRFALINTRLFAALRRLSSGRPFKALTLVSSKRAELGKKLDKMPRATPAIKMSMQFGFHDGADDWTSPSAKASFDKRSFTAIEPFVF